MMPPGRRSHALAGALLAMAAKRALGIPTLGDMGIRYAAPRSADPHFGTKRRAAKRSKADRRRNRGK